MQGLRVTRKHTEVIFRVTPKMAEQFMLQVKDKQAGKTSPDAPYLLVDKDTILVIHTADLESIETVP